MIKNHKNIKHLNDLIIGAITHGNYNDLVYYINKYPSDDLEKLKLKNSFNINFLFHSLLKYQYEISKYLIEMGFIITNIPNLLNSTKIIDIESVYNNLLKLGYDVERHKQSIIIRILDHTKLAANKERINLFHKYVESGFFSSKDISKAMDYLIKEDKIKNSLVRQVIREYQLNKILS